MAWLLVRAVLTTQEFLIADQAQTRSRTLGRFWVLILAWKPKPDLNERTEIDI